MNVYATLRSTNGKILVGVGVLAGLAAVTTSWYFSYKKSKKLVQVLDLIEELNAPHVRIKDREKVEQLITTMIEGGKDKLQVIADFDRTISRYKHDGKLVATCHNVLDQSRRIPDSYRDEAKLLYKTYYPIEIDHTKTIEERYPYMVEWWTKAHNLLVQINLTRALLIQIVKESNLQLRENTSALFHQLHRNQVPTLVFSAGIGDIIELVLQQEALLLDNIKIISNLMDYNLQGTVTGFKGDLIHTYNKNEGAMCNSDYFERHSKCENIILLGDSLGDLRMADGAKNSRNVLRIGFLNDKVDELLPSYLEGYDIVLISDETMDVPLALLKKVL